jgi:radical SAM protein with 4Fe4S-binding SPASM domain
MNGMKLSQYVRVVRRNLLDPVFLFRAAPKVWNYCRYRLGKKGLRVDNAAVTPIHVTFSATRRCNLACSFCGVKEMMAGSAGREGDLGLEQLDTLLRHPLVRRAPLISFSGGEPLLNRDFWKMVALAKRRGHFCNLITNGLLLRRQLDSLRVSRLDTLSVSVYDENLEILRRDLPEINSVVRVRLNHVIRKGSMAADVLPILELATRTGCVGVFFQLVIPDDEKTAADVVHAGDAEYDELVRKASKEFGSRIPIFFPRGVGGDPAVRKCRMPWYMLFCDSDGEIGPCCRFVTGPDYGNLSRDELSDLRNRAPFLELRSELLETGKPLRKCADCFYLDCGFSSDL